MEDNNSQKMLALRPIFRYNERQSFREGIFMSDCKNCAGCGGCGKTLELTEQEIKLLQLLGQYAFLPVARKADDMTPVCLETKDCTIPLQLLEKKGLVDISYDAPLQGADMSAYTDFPIHGSVGLTLRGQQVLELLETQGVS